MKRVMADIDQAFQFVMVNEDSTLSGVVTTDGTEKTRLGIDSEDHPSAITDGFYTMPLAQAWSYAKNIFITDYWNKVWGTMILDQYTANKLVDLSFNVDYPEAIKIMQRAVNALKNGTVLSVDGEMGPLTNKAINGADQTGLMVQFKSYGKQFYQDVVWRHPEDQKDFDGWIRRLNR